MALNIITNALPGLTLAATIERVSDGYVWNPTAVAFQNAPTFANSKIALAEGSTQYAGRYSASVSSLSTPSECRINIHNDGASDEVIGQGTVYVVSDNEVNTAAQTLAIKAKTDSLTFTTSNKVDAKLTADGLDSISTTAPSGVASNFREMLVATWRWFYKKSEYNDTANTIRTYADDGTTVITTATATSSGGTETKGAAT